MNKSTIFSLMICLFLLCCNFKTPDHDDNTIFYTCSMHPSIRETTSGKCPICHMNLVKIQESRTPVKKETKRLWQCRDFPDVVSEQEDICPLDGTKMVAKIQTGKGGVDIVGTVRLRRSHLKHFKAEVIPVTTINMVKSIRLLGVILQSEDQESNIPTRVDGRIEKVFVKSTGSFVSINDPVVEIYAPKLITAGEEYLIARQSYQKTKTREFREMLTQSRKKLQLWGIKDFQYQSWYKKGTVPKSIALYSPATGIVRKRHAIAGKYFKEGQNLLELSNLSSVWVEMDVYEQDTNLISLGQKVSLEFIAIPGEIFTGEIDFIDPVLNPKSRTLKVRTTLSNTKGKLRPGMAADATVTIQLKGQSLVVPRSAVIDTGKRKIVWLQVAGGEFQARAVHTGYESDGHVEIKRGLSLGESVVLDGNFLLDAQAQIFDSYE